MPPQVGGNYARSGGACRDASRSRFSAPGGRPGGHLPPRCPVAAGDTGGWRRCGLCLAGGVLAWGQRSWRGGWPGWERRAASAGRRAGPGAAACRPAGRGRRHRDLIIDHPHRDTLPPRAPGNPQPPIIPPISTPPGAWPPGSPVRPASDVPAIATSPMAPPS